VSKYNKGDLLRHFSEWFIITKVIVDKKLYKLYWVKFLPGSDMDTSVPIENMDNNENVQLICEGANV